MFEHSLIELESRPRPRRWLSMPIAVALHLVAATLFTLASYWSVGEVPEPLMVGDVFYTEPVIPIALLGGGQQPRPVEPEPQPEPEPVRPDEPVQPTLEDVPEDVPTPAPNTTTVDTGFTDPDAPAGPGVPWGRPDGDPDVLVSGGGNVDGPGFTVETPEGPVHLTVGITRPEILHKVAPRYTEAARRAGVQGTVILEAIIDEKGRVTDQRILNSLPMGLDQAAMDAVRQWRFTPAYRGNDPVKVYFVLTVNFSIQR